MIIEFIEITEIIVKALTIPVLSTPEKPGRPWGLFILQESSNSIMMMIMNSMMMMMMIMVMTYFQGARRCRFPQKQRWPCQRRVATYLKREDFKEQQYICEYYKERQCICEVPIKSGNLSVKTLW